MEFYKQPLSGGFTDTLTGYLKKSTFFWRFKTRYNLRLRLIRKDEYRAGKLEFYQQSFCIKTQRPIEVVVAEGYERKQWVKAIA